MWIYLIEQQGTNLYKIGISKNPEERVKQLQTANGVKLDLIKQFKTEFDYKLERVLHRHFQSKKTIGEFFELNENDVKEFTSLCESRESNFKYLVENNSYIRNRGKF